MKHSTKIILTGAALVLGVVAIGSASFASGRWSERHHGYHYGHHKVEMMERFDANGDGAVTAEEMAALRDKALSEHDADKDGALTLEEFQGVWTGYMRPRMVRHFQKLDADGDARVTAEEMRRPMERMLSRMDRNNDGAISKDDMRHRGWDRYDDDDDEYERRGPMGKRY